MRGQSGTDASCGRYMNIWIFNNYNMLPEQGGLNRHYYFAKCFAEMGHQVTVFVGSHPHNTNLQMIEDGAAWKTAFETPFRWVYVHTANYAGSRVKRVLSMLEYYRNGKRAAYALYRQGERPDAILGSSAHPLAAVLAIRMAKRFRCKSIAEVRDLWPESIVAYGIVGPHNPAVIALRWLEKWIYKKADAVVFTMEGAYDYIVEQGWEKEIPRAKVHYINNGVDLEQFDYNKEHFCVEDPDLDDPDTFKVVYTGSIRRVNNLGLLLDAAKCVKNPNIRFLIWGDGDERAALEQRVRDEHIGNVVFKGKVEKKYIPSIVSRADLNFAHNDPSPLFRFGISFNKLFDYLAAGKPVLCDFPCPYNPAVTYGAGIEATDTQPQQIAKAIDALVTSAEQEWQSYCANARRAAEDYDFKRLTDKLIAVIESITEK